MLHFTVYDGLFILLLQRNISHESAFEDDLYLVFGHHSDVVDELSKRLIVKRNRFVLEMFQCFHDFVDAGFRFLCVGLSGFLFGNGCFDCLEFFC